MRVLHVGCGTSPLPEMFDTWYEVRLDIDPSVNPDVVASMLNLPEMGLFDCVYSSHNLEHVYSHEVPIALAQWKRVLKPTGYLQINVPDLEGLSLSEEVLYQSSAGPVTSIDMFYGLRSLTATNPHMQHKTGFTGAILRSALEKAGFKSVFIHKQPLELFGLAFVSEVPEGKFNGNHWSANSN